MSEKESFRRAENDRGIPYSKFFKRLVIPSSADNLPIEGKGEISKGVNPWLYNDFVV